MAKDSLWVLHNNFPLKNFRRGLEGERNTPSCLIDSLFEDSLSSFWKLLVLYFGFFLSLNPALVL